MSDKAPGNIIALAIVMVAMVLLAGFAIGSVVLEGSRSSVETDKAVAAYYMADSGIEMQLYDVRKNGLALSSVASSTSLYPGGSSWISTTGYETSTVKTIDYLAQEDLSFVDLFDPDKINQSAGVSSVKISWNGVAGCQPDLEIGYTVWSTGSTIVWTTTADYSIAIAPATLPAPYSFTLSSLDTSKAYRLRLRPFKCDAKDIRVTMLDSSGSAIAYPGEITLGSEGSYQKTTQRLRVSMPRQDILSGVFSYIVFSQEQLCKNVNGASTCAP